MNKLIVDHQFQFDDKNYIKAGLLFLIMFAGGFGLWVTLSQLDSAAIAIGRISVEGQRKAVEHFEGGIVESVLVEDGDTVAVNQPLIKLSSITAKTRFTQLNLKYFGFLAQLQRLQHERLALKKLQFTNELLDAVMVYPSLGAVLETQRYLFKARLNLRKSQFSSLDAKLQGIQSDKIVLGDKIEQETLALSFIEKEMVMNERLQKDGYSSQLKIYELKRTQAQYKSSVIELKGRLQNNKLAALEVNQEKLSIEYQYISEIGQELQEVSKYTDDTLELLTQAQDVLSRVIIKSPHAGKVAGLSVFSRGDVISPGETLLEVVPNNERLIIVATLKPEDIDVVTLDQDAMVRLSAYNFRSTPPIKGTVIHIAADRLLERGQQRESEGFTIKISINEKELDQLPQVKLHPGMPAEVYINLNKRTAFDYLLEPLTLDFFRAFREI